YKNHKIISSLTAHYHNSASYSDKDIYLLTEFFAAVASRKIYHVKPQHQKACTDYYANSFAILSA
ncbi:MAG TPA: hypothetical protein VKU38_02560, partial [Ktedonobacteraceae bacterium]|nr:hypothetical protein [Ktedonobacteraceae bacterium]